METTCTANFASNLVTLRVTKLGAGSGTVTSTPSGIDGGATCSASYDQGTTVTLAATPAPGSVFGGWSPNCPDGQVMFAGNVQCTATFGTAGADLTGSWIALNQVCRRVAGNARCRVRGRFRMQNVGATGATGSVLRFALSADGTTPTATLKEMTMPAMAPGETERMRVRAAVPGGSARGMFVLAIIDAGETVAESNETNNVIAFGPLP